MERAVEFVDKDGGAPFQGEQHAGEKVDKVLGPCRFFFVETETDFTSFDITVDGFEVDVDGLAIGIAGRRPSLVEGRNLRDLQGSFCFDDG